MSSYNQPYWLAKDCPVCGEKDEHDAWKGARTGACRTTNTMCCSFRCCKRLDMRIRNGLQSKPEEAKVDTKDFRLRVRIKQLEHQLKGTL